MTDPTTLTAKVRRLLPAILAVVALLVPAGIGITIGATLLAPPPTAAPAPSQSTVEIATPSPTPVAVAPLEFSSISGNLRCRIDARSAWCHQGEFEYTPEQDNCALEGVAVGVTTEGPYWPCVKVRPALSPSIAYDTPVVHGEFTCVINFTTGARCTNASGEGFMIEYSAGATVF